MNPKDTKNWNQNDFVVALDILKQKATTLETELSIKTSKLPARPPTNLSDPIAGFDAMEAHVAKLQVLVNLSATQSPAPVADTPAVHSVAPASTTKTSTQAHGKSAWNPDAKILEARGCKTLDELNALPPADPGD